MSEIHHFPPFNPLYTILLKSLFGFLELSDQSLFWRAFTNELAWNLQLFNIPKHRICDSAYMPDHVSIAICNFRPNRFLLIQILSVLHTYEFSDLMLPSQDFNFVLMFISCWMLYFINMAFNICFKRNVLEIQWMIKAFSLSLVLRNENLSSWSFQWTFLTFSFTFLSFSNFLILKYNFHFLFAVYSHQFKFKTQSLMNVKSRWKWLIFKILKSTWFFMFSNFQLV